MAEGEEEMTIPRPQEWTKAEVHQLRMLAKRKVSADSIAKLLGRYAGSSDPLQEGEEEMIGPPTEAALLTWAFFFFR